LLVLVARRVVLLLAATTSNSSSLVLVAGRKAAKGFNAAQACGRVKHKYTSQAQEGCRDNKITSELISTTRGVADCSNLFRLASDKIYLSALIIAIE
jgi:hypothetical protein